MNVSILSSILTKASTGKIVLKSGMSNRTYDFEVGLKESGRALLLRNTTVKGFPTLSLKHF